MTVAREFWSQDATGRDVPLAITFTEEDATVVWDAREREGIVP